MRARQARAPGAVLQQRPARPAGAARGRGRRPAARGGGRQAHRRGAWRRRGGGRGGSRCCGRGLLGRRAQEQVQRGQLHRVGRPGLAHAGHRQPERPAGGARCRSRRPARRACGTAAMAGRHARAPRLRSPAHGQCSAADRSGRAARTPGGRAGGARTGRRRGGRRGRSASGRARERPHFRAGPAPARRLRACARGLVLQRGAPAPRAGSPSRSAGGGPSGVAAQRWWQAGAHRRLRDRRRRPGPGAPSRAGRAQARRRRTSARRSARARPARPAAAGTPATPCRRRPRQSPATWWPGRRRRPARGARRRRARRRRAPQLPKPQSCPLHGIGQAQPGVQAAGRSARPGPERAFAAVSAGAFSPEART